MQKVTPHIICSLVFIHRTVVQCLISAPFLKNCFPWIYTYIHIQLFGPFTFICNFVFQIYTLWHFTFGMPSYFSFQQSYWNILVVLVRAYWNCYPLWSKFYLPGNPLHLFHFISSVFCNVDFMVQQFLYLTICVYIHVCTQIQCR